MATLNAANALMFGSEDDSIYLGVAGTDVSSITNLSAPIPSGLVDCGWINEDGLALNLSDSVDKIRGHQNHGVVKTFMSDSSTGLDTTILETKLELVKSYLNATAEKVTDGEIKVSKLTIPAARKVTRLVGVVDAFDTSDTSIQWRLVLPILELGERDSLSLKIGEITAWHYKMEVLDKFYLISNSPAMLVA